MTTYEEAVAPLRQVCVSTHQLALAIAQSLVKNEFAFPGPVGRKMEEYFGSLSGRDLDLARHKYVLQMTIGFFLQEIVENDRLDVVFIDDNGQHVSLKRESPALTLEIDIGLEDILAEKSIMTELGDRAAGR